MIVGGESQQIQSSEGNFLTENQLKQKYDLPEIQEEEVDIDKLISQEGFRYLDKSLHKKNIQTE